MLTEINKTELSSQDHKRRPRHHKVSNQPILYADKELIDTQTGIKHMKRS